MTDLGEGGWAPTLIYGQPVARARIRSERLEQARPRPKRLDERLPPLPPPRPLLTWRFEFAAAVSPSIPFFLSAPRFPPTRSAPYYLNVKNRQIRVKSPQTWHLFFAWPHKSHSHYTLEKVYLFWKVLQPRPQGFSLKKMGGDEVGIFWSWDVSAVFASFAFKDFVRLLETKESQLAELPGQSALISGK